MLNDNPNAAPADDAGVFKPVFLVFLLLATFMSIFFILYFNRAFAWLVAHGIRTWTWHRYRIHIDFRALQISLLGGRIFFTGLRYHGANETFHIQNGHITWRYWLRRVRDVDIGKDAPRTQETVEKVSGHHASQSSTLPCRVNVSLNGLEWFVYNRSPVYDGILRNLTEDQSADGDSTRGSGVSDHELGHDSASIHRHAKPPIPNNVQAYPQSNDSGSDNGTGANDLPLLLQLFPIHVECRTAALVMGNENTQAVLVVKADGVSGEVDASGTSTPDLYRQIFKVDFHHPVISMKRNEDYREDQESRATRVEEPHQEGPVAKQRGSFLRRHRQVTKRLRNMIPLLRKSVESFSPSSGSGALPPNPSGAHRWQGLSRYLHDDIEDKARWASVEYAADPTIVDSPSATMTIFWDVPTKVGQSVGSASATSLPRTDDINGDTPPAWGIHLSLQGGSMNYGPWADRQRAELQRFFFPSLSKDATPAQPLKSGEYRTATKFTMLVELDKEVTVRVPIREPSKNWRFKDKKPEAEQGPVQQNRKQRARAKKTNSDNATRIRPAGWLALKVAANATISYSMDMVAGESGYSSVVDVELPDTELSSSVNHELLWRSGPKRISCDLSTPLKWNALRTWHFDISNERLELFLLRDHIFLLIDLVDDWTTGPSPDYLLFTPFKYKINLDLTNVKVFFNVNDSNIINDPTSMDENTYIILSSQLLHAELCIPIDTFRPAKNAIPFDVRVDSLGVDLHLPLYNTQATLLRSKTIGQAESVVLDGSYHYNATSSPANIDTLVLNAVGQCPTFTSYGFTLRYFLSLKENYFGDHVHFRTLEEYQKSLAQDPDSAAVQGSQKPHQVSNDMDVILSVRIDDPRLLLPGNIYDASHSIQVETAYLGVDLRFTNYYMDLDLSLSPLSLSLGAEDNAAETLRPVSASTQLFIDGLHIYGHRVFGLPPSEPTYLCNWDISTGPVTGECTAEFLTTLARGAQAFIFGFEDEENALVPYSSILMFDVTFLRLAIQSVKVWLHVDEAAFLLSTDTISVKFNDWARSHYSTRANVNVPNLQLSCVDSEVATRHKSRYRHDISPEALLKTSIHLAAIGRKFEFTKERKMQQELVRREDQRTHRTQFLLFPELMDELDPDGTDPPAQCVPPIPVPATERDVSDGGTSTTASAPSLQLPSMRRQSSFLSLSSSSGRSVIRTSPSRSRSRNPSIFQAERRTEHLREFSTSSEHPSAYNSLRGEFGHGDASRPSVVTFASQYFAPHFPLENLRPDTAKTAIPSMVEDDDLTKPAGFNLEDIDPEILDEDHTYNSIIVEFPTGISVVLNPLSVRYASALISALQPSSPEDVLDGLQMDCMAHLTDLKCLDKIKGEVSDLMVRLPSANIRFLNSPAAEFEKATDQAQDQYDVVVNSVAFITRETVKWGDVYDSATRTARRSLHLRLDSVELTALQRYHDVDETETAVMAHIEHAVISTGSRDVTYIEAQIGAIRGSTASGKIEYLASLVHRTNLLVTEIGELFSNVVSKKEDRLKFLVWSLATLNHQTGDAPFFTRPSAVLRSAQDQLRTFDSWKLVLHLRQIWFDMGPAERERLNLACWATHPTPPENAAHEMMDAFQRWRSWDLGNLSESILLQKTFGLVSEKHAAPAEIPLLAVCHVDEVEMVLDPGPKENKITILDLDARLEQSDHRREEHQDVQDVEGPLTAVNIYCEEAAMKINWELCELANNLLRLHLGGSHGEKPEHEQDREEKEPPSSAPPHALHVALAVGKGSVAVDTINLNAKSLAHGLTVSLLTHGASDEGAATNFLIACDGLTSRLHSHSQLLGMFQLRQPSVFVSHEVQRSDSVDSHTVKSTASSKDLTLVIKQDPIALLEVVDLLVRDEIAQLYRLKSQLPRSAPEDVSRRRGRKIIERLSAYRVNVALFLDEYNISVPLLQSLTYNISGVVARAAMAANFGNEVIFDFDVSENSHEILIDVNNKPRGISLLSIPPTNGRVTGLMGDLEHSVTLFASVEQIQLDASAVYSLLRALNRPEIANAINDAQEQVKIISGHFDDIMDREPVAEALADSQQKLKLVYNLHLTMAGLRIFGTTRLGSETDSAAHVFACLDRMHFEMSNRVEARGPVLDHPELHVHLGKILLDLQKGTEGAMRSYGSVAFSALISATTKTGANGEDERAFGFRSDGFEVNMSPETVSTLMYVLNHLGDKIKDLDTSRELGYLRKLRQSKPRIAINDHEEAAPADFIDSFLSSFVYQFEVHNARLSWLIVDDPFGPYTGKEDLVLSVGLFEFGTRKTRSARLTIQNFQLQMVPPGFEKHLRSHHSALLPEVIFNVAYVSTAHARRLAFQAVGKTVDIRLTSGFIIPASNLKDSLALSIENIQQASQNWNSGTSATKPEETTSVPSTLGAKRLESLLVDADFAGAVVHLAAKKNYGAAQRLYARPGRSAGGKYGQFSDDSGGSTSLRSPGLALKMQYRDDGVDHPALCGEVKVEGSNNILYPTVVPLLLEITSSIKEAVSRNADSPTAAAAADPASPLKASEGDRILTANADAVLGRVKLNLGLRICKQEFSLSCQPIARVAASTLLQNIYVTVNTVRSNEAGNFIAVSAAISGLQASVQHVYSRESTGSFEVDSIVLSLMNSKHFSGKSGVSAILKFSPMKVAVNAKQLQDFLLFREIWYPAELRQASVAPVAKLQTETSQGHLVQRYQQVAATAAFPWTATLSISSVEISMDLGQAIGKSVFAINDFWVSSKKTSDWEQNLCLGFARVGADCTGRLSGFVALQDFRLRSMIQWPKREQALNETPLIQASIAFSQFRLKAAFDYQVFLIADITSMEFLMYNVRRSMDGSGDRLVAIFDGNAIQVFGTTASAALGIALYQAFQKLVQERKGSFESSLREIERFMKRRIPSLTAATAAQVSQQQRSTRPKLAEDDTLAKSPISLDTDVMVTLKALNLGVFPNTFWDKQVFKMEALDAQARFTASIVQRRIHSILDLTLGQLRIGLATVRDGSTAGSAGKAGKAPMDMSVEDVARRATGSRGGTILKVPRVHATMETWQKPRDTRIEYIFKSAFEGKVEVGWNYSRISYIRGMWAKHTKMLQQTWGKELAVTAIRVTGVPTSSGGGAGGDGDDGVGGTGGGGDAGAAKDGQSKITAEVNVPQSKYEYVPLEEAVIETPRLKEMGEATPPLEWIGLQREKLPNLMHQFAIMALLELAGEVEDAYGRIMGSS